MSVVTFRRRVVPCAVSPYYGAARPRVRARSSTLADHVPFRLATAAAFAFATAALGYAWVRVAETSLFQQADPRTVVAVTQSGFFVRCGVAALTAGMGAFAGWALSRTPARAARALVVAAPLSALALALQAWLAP